MYPYAAYCSVKFSKKSQICSKEEPKWRIMRVLYIQSEVKACVNLKLALFL